MKHILSLFILISLANVLSAQYVYTIKADSVKITNCDSAELIIENHTQAIPGFLFNTGNGRTVFQHGLIKLNDSLYLLGADTLNLNQGLLALLKANNGLSVFGGKVVLGNNTGDTSASLSSDRTIPMSTHSIFLGNSATGERTQLLAGGLNISTKVLNSSGFGGVFNMSGRLDFQNSSSGSTLSTGTTNFNVSYTPHGTNSNANILSTNISIGGSFTPSGAGNFGYTSLLLNPYYDFTGYSTGSNMYRDVRGIYYNVFVDGTIPRRHVAYENTSGDNIFNSGDWGNTNMGKSGFHAIATPTAYVHIGAGASSPSTAPLKFTAGSILTTPENGAVEYDGTDFYLTVTSGTRYKLVKALTGQLSTNFGGSSLSASGAVTATVSVTGVQPGDVVSVNGNSGVVNPPQIIITAFVTTANTVTIQAFNAGSTSVTLASDTYKVKILQ